MFGEHQDYLQLPIIACAISKRIYIEGAKRNDLNVNIELPDIFEKEAFKFEGGFSYTKEIDYYKSSVNVLLEEGFTFTNGFDCIVHGDIPINAGAASSSALVVSWINFLARISDQAIELTPEKIAQLAYKAEVLEFSEPGGMMDHYSASFGGVIGLSSYPEINVKKVKTELGAFVLGNSGEPKDTKYILTRVKKGVLDIINNLKNKYPNFSLQNINLNDLDNFKNDLRSEQFKLLSGTIHNRDITREANEVLERDPLDHEYMGKLINEHQHVLHDVLKVSTPKIDAMIQAALDAGAYGAKINGSGGGGCMFAYVPENTDNVLFAVKNIAKETYIVSCDEGTRIEYSEELQGEW